MSDLCLFFFFFFQAEDGIRDIGVTGVQTCALPILAGARGKPDRAEERPGRAVDRERERIDHHPRAAAIARSRAVAVARDHEQQPDVAERNDDDDPALQHSVSWKTSLGSSAAGNKRPATL